MAQVLKKCDCRNKTRCGHRWTVRYREPGGRSARQRERSFPTKKEAESFGVKAENDKRQGVYIDPQLGQISLRKWAEEWLEQHQVNESTRRNYQGFLSNHLIPELGSRTLAGLTVADVKKLQASMAGRGLTAATVNDRLNILRSMMTAAVKERRIPDSPCDEVPPLKAAGAAVDPDEIPTLVEVNAIAAAMSEQYRLTVWLQAGAGLRISETLGFSVDCQRDGFLRLRRQISAKANQGDCVTRFVPLKHRTPEEFRDVPTPTFLDQEIGLHLKRWGTVVLDGLEVLFAPRERGKGKMPTASTYGYHWRKALKAAGVTTSDGKPKYTPHSLRHFFASTALANGVPRGEPLARATATSRRPSTRTGTSSRRRGTAAATSCRRRCARRFPARRRSRRRRWRRDVLTARHRADLVLTLGLFQGWNPMGILGRRGFHERSASTFNGKAHFHPPELRARGAPQSVRAPLGAR